MDDTNTIFQCLPITEQYLKEAQVDDDLKASCKICQMPIDSRNSISHYNKCYLNNTKNKYVCLICDVRFSTKSNLNKHLMVHEQLLSGPATGIEEAAIEVEKKFDFENSNAAYSFSKRQIIKDDNVPGMDNKCPICKDFVLNESNYTLHMTLKHGRPSPPTSINSGFQNCSDITRDLLSYRINKNVNSIEQNWSKCEKPERVRTSRKISDIFRNIVAETVYSSDSDCEYEIIQTIIKIQTKESKFQCKFCHRFFVKAKSLQAHIAKAHENNERDLRTNLEIQPTSINDNWTIVEDTIDILNNLNPINTNSSQNKHDKIPKVTHKTRRLLLKCRYCFRTFKHTSNLSNHLKSHIKQSIGSRRILKEHENHSAIDDVSTRFSCKVCRKLFFDKFTFENHLSTHDNKGLPNNGRSNDEYPTDKTFEENIVNNRTIEGKNPIEENIIKVRSHLCTICGKSFSRSSNLTIHLRNHNNFKPYLCSICGKGFTIKRYLTIHFRTHTKELPFECQHCKKKFSQKGNLEEHLRTHTGSKPHGCSKCGKSFAHSSGLRQHLLTHTSTKKHQCHVCGKQFRFGGHFKEHMRTHSGLKPYKCKVCDRSFSCNSSLIVHLRTHSGERPFKCSTCNHGFIKSYGLKQHYKSHPTHDLLSQSQ